MKEKILNFHTFFELHRMNVASVQYSSKITQFMKVKQQKTKQLIFLNKKKSNKKTTMRKGKQI
jgi:hypothetical protein